MGFHDIWHNKQCSFTNTAYEIANIPRTQVTNAMQLYHRQTLFNPLHRLSDLHFYVSTFVVVFVTVLRCCFVCIPARRLIFRIRLYGFSLFFFLSVQLFEMLRLSTHN